MVMKFDVSAIVHSEYVDACATPKWIIHVYEDFFTFQ